MLLLLLATRLFLSPQPLADVDSAGYDLLAQNLLAGRGFTINSETPYCPESVRTPVYPAFVALSYAVFGRDFQMIFILQSLLEMVTAAVVYRLVMGLTRSYRAGLIAVLCYLLSLSQIHYANLLLTESLLTFLLAMTLFLFWASIQSGKRRYLLSTGVMLGLAVLCKPNAELLPIAFIGGLLLRRRFSFTQRLQHMTIMTVGLMTILLPWYGRNWTVFGDVFLSRTYDDNIARVAAVATLAEVIGEDVIVWSARWEDLYFGLVAQAAARFGWSGDGLSCAEGERRRADVGLVAMEVIRAHPGAFIISYVKGVVRGLMSQEQLYWYSQLTGESYDDTLRYLELPASELPPLLLIMGIVWAAGYVLVYTGIAMGLFWLFRRAGWLALAVIALLVMGWVLPGPLAWVRHRVPVVPHMVILYVIGWWWVVQAWLNAK